jgi:hypothetical protein
MMSVLRKVLEVADVDAPVLDVIADLSWTVLEFTKVKHPCFRKHLPTQDALKAMCDTLDLEFPPDLLDILDADTPPTIECLKTIPVYTKYTTEDDKCWAIYVVVLEKHGHRHRVYIGSGTEKKYGVHSRMMNYERLDDTNMAKYVRQAIDDGYDITFMGLLAWCPIPETTQQAAVRTLFHVFEALFAFALWAMYENHYGNDWGMEEMCL